MQRLEGPRSYGQHTIDYSCTMPAVAALHAVVGYALLGLLGTYTVGNLVAWRTARPFRGLERLFQLIVLALAVQSLHGVVMLVAGQRPSEWLHILYTVAALITLLATRGLAVGVPAAQERLMIGAGSAIATVLLARVTATG